MKAGDIYKTLSSCIVLITDATDDQISYRILSGETVTSSLKDNEKGYRLIGSVE